MTGEPRCLKFIIPPVIRQNNAAFIYVTLTTTTQDGTCFCNAQMYKLKIYLKHLYS